jgi:hypothetical protein
MTTINSVPLKYKWTLVMRFKHRCMPSPGETDSQLKDPSTDPSEIARGSGVIPIRYTHVYPLAKDQAKPEHALGLCSGLRGSLEPQAPNQRQPELDPRAQPQPEPMHGQESYAPSIISQLVEHPRLGSPQRHPDQWAHSAVTHSSEKVTQAA